MDASQSDSLRQEAALLGEKGGFGRSRIVQALFDYLVEATLAGRKPKEAEIAIDVFGRGADFDPVQDAAVRVYVHKLRRLLGERYAKAPPGSPRLVLKPGEYRISVETVENGAVETPPAAPLVWYRGRMTVAAIVLLLLLAIAALLLYRYSVDRPATSGTVASSSPMWGRLLANGKPTTIVLGDYYLIAETEDMQVRRLVREFSVNSPLELEMFLDRHPEKAAIYENSGIRYLPTSAGFALAKILPVILASGEGGAPDVMLASELNASVIREHNIVYIGYFSGLGALRDVVSDSSRFVFGPSYDELTDMMTDRHYVGQAFDPGEPNSPYVEYGVLSSFAGPGGNRILVIAGTRDVAVRQIAEVAAGQAPADMAKGAPFLSDDGEVLVKVTGLDGVNIEASVVVGAMINADHIWRRDDRPPPGG